MKRCDVTDEELEMFAQAWAKESGALMGGRGSKLCEALRELQRRRALDERQELERSLAYTAALTCLDGLGTSAESGGLVDDFSHLEPGELQAVTECVGYLESRGLIERGEGEFWVRDESEATDGD